MAKIRYAEPTGNARLDSFLRRHIDELNAEISLISRSLEKSTAELTEKVNETAEVPSVIREKVEQHSQQIGDITTRLTEAEANITSLFGVLQSVQLDIINIKDEISELWSRI